MVEESTESLLPPLGPPRRSWRYAAARLNEEYHLRRWRIRPALRQSATYVSEHQLGFAERACGYHHPTAEHVYGAFRAAMTRFVKPQRKDVFVDYGSGLGSAMIMAATFPFARIIGVEISPELSERAREIIAPIRSTLACQDIQINTCDALAYELPAEATVIYFFNPFWGEILDEVMNKIYRSFQKTPRSLRIISFWPENIGKAAAGRPWLQQIGEVKYPDNYPVPFRAPFRVYRAV